MTELPGSLSREQQLKIMELLKMQSLKPPVTSSLLGLNIQRGVLFSNSSSLNVR
jgi:hypothetical protein